ncbi:methylenetetrahydrofolate reductase [methane-oxidizing endosymbiont of Gigantopelta aegis]|uniref:methylenetetrahydrofolate reductase n=1 Tax=methane-oxidizing endosymbiont of Gigantopelta aegis TaxID=2794938 RepID=UPI0018DE9794|nr:methylenetetrahydrofolate reductase [methane-oxidizing endosymbiont of Gigantopelta aegis]
MEVSFEIVPRNRQAFDQQYQFAQSMVGRFQFINVPDIQRFNIRSWECNAFIDPEQHHFVPHFRAIDFDLKEGRIFQIIEQHELSHVLLVTGDPPDGLNRVFFNTSVLDMIRAVKQRFPNIKVYAGFDPHRSGVQDECLYIQRKTEAGADGFFSQPFYDIRMVEIYLEQMQGLETFIGLSPITTESSKHYWEVKNKVQFPANFRPDYDWNITFANQAIQLAKETGNNIYFMPIRIDLEKYFSKIVLD